MSRVTVNAFGKALAGIATGQCLCGKVQVEISIPAFWAWHSRCVYAGRGVMWTGPKRRKRPTAPDMAFAP